MDGKTLQDVKIEDRNFTTQANDAVTTFESESSAAAAATPLQSAASGNDSRIGTTAPPSSTANAPSLQAGSGKAVNKTVYCVLAMLLGGIGAHKFYAGRIGAGICYFIFCWTFLPFVIALFEAIFALWKRADAAGNIII